MHDDLLERRLRTALRDEADRMPFTITAPELERRVALRGRGVGNRRLGMLLAAAVGIGLVGVGGVIGRLTNPPAPSPISQATNPAVTPTSPAATATAEPLLPSLDDMVAAAGADPVLVAQAHGPADGPDPQLAQFAFAGSSVSLGDVAGSIGYALAYGCLGDGQIVLDVRVPGGRGPQSGPTAACDGAMHEELIGADGPRSISLVTTAPASWRVRVRALSAVNPGPSTVVPSLQPGGDQEEALIDQQGMTVDAGGPNPTDHCCRVGTLIRQEVGAVPGRLDYLVRASCTGGDAIRYIHGDEIDGRFVARTTTQIACDGLVHVLGLGIPEPYGSRVFVAADAGTTWSVLVTSQQPPVSLMEDLPGYQHVASAGPSYAFEAHGYSAGGVGGESAGPVVVALACTGTQAIEVTVELGPPGKVRIETFLASCAPEGALTSRTFAADGPDVSVRYVAPKGSWSAMTILVPVSQS